MIYPPRKRGISFALQASLWRLFAISFCSASTLIENERHFFLLVQKEVAKEKHA